MTPVKDQLQRQVDGRRDALGRSAIASGALAMAMTVADLAAAGAVRERLLVGSTAHSRG